LKQGQSSRRLFLPPGAPYTRRDPMVPRRVYLELHNLLCFQRTSSFPHNTPSKIFAVFLILVGVSSKTLLSSPIVITATFTFFFCPALPPLSPFTVTASAVLNDELLLPGCDLLLRVYRTGLLTDTRDALPRPDFVVSHVRLIVSSPGHLLLSFGFLVRVFIPLLSSPEQSPTFPPSSSPGSSGTLGSDSTSRAHLPFRSL